MGDKKPAENVGKLIKKHAKKPKPMPTVAKRMKSVKKPTPKGEPKNVLALIAKHLRGR